MNGQFCWRNNLIDTNICNVIVVVELDLLQKSMGKNYSIEDYRNNGNVYSETVTFI